MKLFLSKDHLIIKGSDVILGLPSIGNLGQIAMDCIISTLLNDNIIVKLGYIESQFILPMVGYDSFVENKVDICLPIEVYRMNNNSNMILIIQRSLCMKGQQKSFSLELLHWLQYDIACNNCFLLTGSSINSSDRNDNINYNSSDNNNNLKAVAVTNKSDIFYSSIYPIQHSYHSGLTSKYINLLRSLEDCQYVSSTNTTTSCDPVEAINKIGLEFDSCFDYQYSSSDNRSSQRCSGELYDNFKGMLLSKNILEAYSINHNTTDTITSNSNDNIISDDSMRLLLIGKLCIEGDNNINDGIQLAHKVIQSLNLYSSNNNKNNTTTSNNNNTNLDNTLKQPSSWKQQYGRELQSMESSMFY